MNTPRPKPDEALLKEPPEFSLVLGGPLFRLWKRSRLAGDDLQLLPRRVLVLVFLTWVPLLAFSIAEGHARAGSVALPFLRDLEMHIRLLLAMPLLILAEPVARQRMRRIVQQFWERDLIPDDARSKFDSAVASALRWRDSTAAEVLLLAFVYVVGVGVIWWGHVALGVASWYGVTLNGNAPDATGWGWPA